MKILNESFRIEELNKSELGEMSSLLQLVWKLSFEDFLSPAPAAILFSIFRLQQMIENPDFFVRAAKSQNNQVTVPG